MSLTTRRTRSLAVLLPAAVAAGAALVINALVPLLSPLLIALVLGVVVANTPLGERPLMRSQAKPTKLLLRLGVVMLGLKLPASDIIQIGPVGIVVVVVTVAVTYTATIVLGDRMKLDRGFVTLVAAGFSICGAAAIAAVEDTARARQRDVALAVAMVTLYGSAMIALVPWLAHLVGLSEEQAALWAGASIHEVAQVAAAAALIGSGAVAIAMTVKLGRVVLLAPVYLLASRRGQRDAGQRVPLVPWFVVGFALAVLIRSTGVLNEPVLHVTDLATSFLLAAGMFGLGVGIRMKDLWPVPVGALVLSTASTVVAAGVSLTLITTLT